MTRRVGDGMLGIEVARVDQAGVSVEATPGRRSEVQ
jgi:hypothetical protein